MTINEIQDEIIEDFTLVDDWMERYEMIIEMGNELEPFPESEKTPDHIIEGCQSRVWVVGHPQEDGTIHYEADSDAIIVKGIIALLLRIVDDQPAEEVAQADFYFIDRIGLRENLSPTRSNGVLSMIRDIKLIATEALSERS